MRSRPTTPRDQPVRDRLVTQFDRNLLVEAGAGSGKTYSLAARMAAGIAAGVYRVEHMAAVTFTRKAAAELRGRFGLALEAHLRRTTSAAERERLEAALAGLERLFAGTIHAFCAHLLRERPVDADLAPDFLELDDVENLRRQRQAWRDYVAAARASGVRPMLDLLEAGIRPKDLDDAFAAVCEHEDVAFDPGDGEPPDLDTTLRRVERFWAALAAVTPPAFAPDTRCEAQQKHDEFDGRLANVRRQRRLAGLASLLTFWGGTTVTAVWWSERIGREKSYGQRAKALVDDFRTGVVEPFLAQWRAYVHRLALEVLDEARRTYAEARRRQNAVNYVDLLRRTAALLRDHADVRRALQRKYRWLFVDEFQDTDPLQAEIFLMLAADEPEASVRASAKRTAGRVPGPCDPFALPLRRGALFVVGDPKQSIYRFRRADIDIYLRVRERIERTGGEVRSLTANFRSLPGVCALANTVLPPLFAQHALPYSPAFEALDPVRPEAKDHQGACVATLTVPATGTSAERVQREAERIAAAIQAEVAAGRRHYGDYLVLTRSKPRLRVYAEALDALEIPVEVSGAGLFCASPEVRALALLLRALADPLDAVSLVGVLRGPLFGLSDPELFQFRQAGGRFELTVPLPEATDPKAAAALDRQYGPVLAAMRRLQEMLHATRRLPLAAAVERMLEETGWLALASTTPGGARAGHLLQAVDRVREVVEDGGGLLAAADALDEEEVSNEAEALPLRPGRRDVVRLMNLHKAKGLEAPVVFLADAGHAFEFGTTVRVVREGSRARGYLRVVRTVEGKPWLTTVLGEPADWDQHEQEERRYREAEKLRLLYVAGTRAKDLLVVCRTDDPRKNKAWGAFDGYLRTMPELKVPSTPRVPKREVPDLSAAAREKADVQRLALHDRVQHASWAVMTPTGAKGVEAPGAPAERIASGAAQAEGQAARDTQAGPTPLPTGTRRGDAGVAWGTLVHGLLEHAMRHATATRGDLERLARWLTMEQPELRAVIPEALDLVEAVKQAPFWDEARAGGEVHAEVPFAVRVEAGTSVPGVPAVETQTVLRGVIDLVYRAADGWRILDYKTDRLEGVGDVQGELERRYGMQIAQYGFGLVRVTGNEAVSARLIALRGRQGA
jgi:ATP-dependent helicase/nuclease subunit A